MQSQHKVYKAGKLTFTHVNFYSYQVSWSSISLIIPSDHFCILSDSAVSKQLAVLPISLNFQIIQGT